MYSKTYKSRFTAVVIGKKLILALLAAVVATISCISLSLTLGRHMDADFSAFHRRMLYDALPLVACSDDITLMSDISAVVKLVSGLDIHNPLSNFEIMAAFCEVGDYELPSEKTLAQEELTLPVVNVVRENSSDAELKIKNETPYNIDTAALLKRPSDIYVSEDLPSILIVHTHGTESYTQSEKYHYSDADSPRCEDTRYNVVRVGEELASELTSMGYNVLHDKSLNDTPSYNNSYNKTLSVIESYLEKYPSIQCVLDVHRDALEREDGTKVKFTADIKGENVSQVMIVCGTDGLGLEHPNWQSNLSFALKIQNYMNGKYPGIMRPVNLRKERFNMHKTPGSLILEFGTHGNTLDEALASVKYIAEGIGEALDKK